MAIMASSMMAATQGSVHNVQIPGNDSIGYVASASLPPLGNTQKASWFVEFYNVSPHGNE